MRRARISVGSMLSMRAGRGRRRSRSGSASPARSAPGRRCSCSAMRQQAGGHLLARGDHDVVFARVVPARDVWSVQATSWLVAPAMAETTTATSWPASTSALHPPRDAPDALEVGDRRAAEFLHDARHALSYLRRARYDRASGKTAARLRLPAGRRVFILGAAPPKQARATRKADPQHYEHESPASEPPYPRPLQHRSRRGRPVRRDRRGLVGPERQVRARCTSSIRSGSTSSATGWPPISAATPRRGAPFAGLRLLDIGCGGGLLAEPMTRLGFRSPASTPPSATSARRPPMPPSRGWRSTTAPPPPRPWSRPASASTWSSTWR